jgi:hypothetical protein
MDDGTVVHSGNVTPNNDSIIIVSYTSLFTRLSLNISILYIWIYRIRRDDETLIIYIYVYLLSQNLKILKSLFQYLFSKSDAEETEKPQVILQKKKLTAAAAAACIIYMLI